MIMKQVERIILAITGATGMLYIPPFLDILKQSDIKVHAIISNAGCKVLKLESGIEHTDLVGIDRWFGIDEFTAQ